ncbi:MAG TPA: RHS repeat-associated core domain-containing protein [Candidatus Methylacidiphilales bacterium]|nr:RHS repeat-associated core domain-containing protein [Candidatus Methylacidiphilales bacterium]
MSWNDPAWWSSRGAVLPEQVITNNNVVTTNYLFNDNAAVLQGQLKLFTTRAVDELNANLPGGAGNNLNNIVSNWAADYATNGYATNTASPTYPYKPSDLDVENVGQLKYVGNMVWNQLVAGGYTNIVPNTAVPSWLPTNAADGNVANLGQLKTLFDFDLSYSSANNGLPDLWQIKYFGTTGLNPASLAPNGDGLTLLQCYQQGIDPNPPQTGPAEPFAVSVSATGPFQAPAFPLLIANLALPSNTTILSVTFYPGTTATGTPLGTVTEASSTTSSNATYEFVLSDLQPGNYSYTAVATWQNNTTLETTQASATTQFQVTGDNFYKRGISPEPIFNSTIIAVDFEQGQYLDGEQNTTPSNYTNLYSNAQYPWFLRTLQTPNEAKEPWQHIDETFVLSVTSNGTITTTGQQNLSAGQEITITGAITTTNAPDTSLNGTFLVGAIPTSTSVTLETLSDGPVTLTTNYYPGSGTATYYSTFNAIPTINGAAVGGAPPLVAFGNQGGQGSGSPLYTNQSYNFGVAAGGQLVFNPIKITSISSAIPSSVYTLSSITGLYVGQMIVISGAIGNTAVNGTYLIGTISGSTITLTTLSGASVGGITSYTGSSASINASVPLTIASISSASPSVYSMPSTAGLHVGQMVVISGATGNTAVNGTYLIGQVQTSTNVTLTTPTGASVGGITGYTANSGAINNADMKVEVYQASAFTSGSNNIAPVYTQGFTLPRPGNNTTWNNFVTNSYVQDYPIVQTLPPLAISSISSGTNPAILTTSNNHDLQPGQPIMIGGVRGSTNTIATTFNGVFTVGTTPNPTELTLNTLSGTGVASTTGTYTQGSGSLTPLPSSSATISSVTNNVLTITGNGPQTGQIVIISGAAGTGTNIATNLNGAFVVSTLANQPNELTLTTLSGSAVTSTGTYTQGSGSISVLPFSNITIASVTTGASTNVTLTTEAPSGLQPGQMVFISSATGTGSNNTIASNLNGAFVASSSTVPTSTNLTLTALNGGSISLTGTYTAASGIITPVSANTINFDTQVQYEGPVINLATFTWGQEVNYALQVTHRAANPLFDYKVSYMGVTAADNGASLSVSGTDVPSAASDSPMAVDSSNNQVYNVDYTLDFDNQPPTAPTVVSQPQFQETPQPTLTQGMSVAELIADAPPVVSTLDPPGSSVWSSTYGFTSSNAFTATNNSPELRDHPLLDQFVASMNNDPIALANYVLNEINLCDAIGYDPSFQWRGISNGQITNNDLVLIYSVNNSSGVLTTSNNTNLTPGQLIIINGATIGTNDAPDTSLNGTFMVKAVSTPTSLTLQTLSGGSVTLTGSYNANSGTIIPLPASSIAISSVSNSVLTTTTPDNLYPGEYIYITGATGTGTIASELNAPYMVATTPTPTSVTLDALTGGAVSLTGTYNAYSGVINTTDQSVNPQGVRRDAMATFLEGQGSPTEQCALLIYLLREAGYPCAYVFPNQDQMLMIEQQLSSMLRMQIQGATGPWGPDGIPQLIPVNYPWVAAYINGQWVNIFPWLKNTVMQEGPDLWSYLPDGYQTGGQWLLHYAEDDPTIRQLTTPGGVYTDDVNVLFPLYVQQQLQGTNLSIDQLGMTWYNQQVYYTCWQDFPRPWQTPVVIDANLAQNLDYTQNPAALAPALYNIFDTISIQVFSDQKGTGQYVSGEPVINTGPMRLCDLHDRRLLLYDEVTSTNNAPNPTYNMILSLEPFNAGNSSSTSNGSLYPHYYTFNGGSAYNGTNTPDPVSDGLMSQQIADTTLTSSDDPLVYSITYNLQQQSQWIPSIEPWNFFLGTANLRTLTDNRPLRKGDMACLSLSYGQVTQQMEDFQAEKYWNYQQAAAQTAATNPNAPANPELGEGQLLNLMGQCYFYKVSQLMRNAESWTKANIMTTLSHGLSKLSPLRNSSNQLVLSTSNDLILCYPRVDMVIENGAFVSNSTYNLNSGDTGNTALYNLWTLLIGGSSVDEHLTLNEFFQQDAAVSTMKLLDLAQGWTPGGSPVPINGNGTYSGGGKITNPPRPSGGTLTAPLFITAATATSPCQITTSSANNLKVGQMIAISGATGNTAINNGGIPVVVASIISPTTFTVSSTAINGNGVYAGGGTISSPSLVITSATDASPCVITTSNTDNLTPGQMIVISGATGNTAINGTAVVATTNSATTFTAYSLGGMATNPGFSGTNQPLVLTAANYLTAGTNSYTSNGYTQNLAQWCGSTNANPAIPAPSGSIWGNIQSVFQLTSTNSSTTFPSITTVYITPGPVTATAQVATPVVGITPQKYTGIGALVISPESFGAFISPNLLVSSNGVLDNGGFAGANSYDLPVYTDPVSDIEDMLLNGTPNASYTVSNSIGTIDTTSINNINPTSSFAPDTISVSDVATLSSELSSGNIVDTSPQLFDLDTFADQYYLTSTNIASYGATTAATTQSLYDVGDIGPTDYYGLMQSLGATGATSDAHSLGDAVYDPVNAVTGEFYVNALDLRLNGPMPLEIRRIYGSFNPAGNNFGYGWRMSYFPYLMFSSDGAYSSSNTVTTTQPTMIYAAETDGSVIAYRNQSSGTNSYWVPKASDNLNLTNTADGGGNLFNNRINYSTTTVNGTVYSVYNLIGANGSVRNFMVQSFPTTTNGSTTLSMARPYLQTWTDNRGNYYNFCYGTSSNSPDYGQVNFIKSSNGDSVAFDYDTDGHIIEAFTGDGRFLYYQYDSFGDLTQVTLPDASTISYDYQHVLVPASQGNPVPGNGTYTTNSAIITSDSNIPIISATDTTNCTLATSTTNHLVAGDVVVISGAKGNTAINGTFTVGSVGSGTNTFTLRAGAAPATVDSTHLITQETKPDGRLLQNVYDSSNQVIAQSATVGPNETLVQNASFSYGAKTSDTNDPGTFDGTNTITDVFGNVTTYKYTANQIAEIDYPAQTTSNIGQPSTGPVTKQTWYYTTGGNGYQRSLATSIDKPTSTNEPGLQSSYTYDGNGNLLTRTVTGNLTGGTSYSETSTTTNTYDTSVVTLPAKLPNGGAITAVPNTLASMTCQIDDPADGNNLGAKLTTSNTYGNSAYPYLPTAITKSAGSTMISTTSNTYGNVTGTNTSAYGLLTQRTDGAGSSTPSVCQYTYNSNGFLCQKTELTQTSDPNVATSYTYDLRGEMTSQTDAAGQSTQYMYDALGHQTAAERFDQWGNLVSWNFTGYNQNGDVEWVQGPRYSPNDYVYKQYDGAGRLSQEVKWLSAAQSGGTGVSQSGYATTTYTHDDFGNLTGVVDPNGNETFMTYDALGEMLSRTVSSSSDVPASAESFAYEPSGQIATHINMLGGAENRNYTSVGQLMNDTMPDTSEKQYRYDLSGRPTRETLPNGSYWVTQYNDAALTVTHSLYPQSGGTALMTETDVYDPRGNVISKTDVSGYRFQTTYDGLNRVKTVTGPGASGNSAQQTSFYTYDAAGQKLIVANAAGEETVTYYDAEQRPTQVSVLNSNGNTITNTSYSYAPDHNSYSVTVGTGAANSAAPAVSTTNYTDTRGNTVLVVHGDGSYEETAYDADGNKISYTGETVPVNTGGNVAPVTTWSYDALNRVLAETLPGGQTTSLTYTLNSPGETIQSAMSTGSSNQAVTQQTTYDSAGRETQEELIGTGGVTTRQYSLSYYTSTNNGGVPGLLASENDPRGVVTTMTYDSCMRPSMVVSTNGVTAYQNQNTSYTYDNRGMVETVTQGYATAGAGMSSTQVVRSYDGYGQISSESVYVNTNDLTGTNAFTSTNMVSQWSQSWDNAGRRTALNFGLAPQGGGHGNQYGYQYNAAGLLTQVNNNGQSYQYSYGDDSLLTQRATPYLTQSIASRDTRGRILDENTVSATNTLISEAMTWRNDGRLSNYQLTGGYTGGAETARNYGYDARGQLITEPFDLYTSTNAAGLVTGTQTAAGAQTATNYFDQSTLDTNNSYGAAGTQGGLGVRTSQLVSASSRNSVQTQDTFKRPTLDAAYASNITNGVNPWALTYDAAGNVSNRTITSGSNQTLTWDAGNRLVQVAQSNTGTNDFVWTTTYDGFGRRVQTVVQPSAGSATTLTYYYDPQVEFLELGINNNGSRMWRVYGPDRNGSYGGLQGCGGLEAMITESSGSAYGEINNYFGDAIGEMVSGTPQWWNNTLGGYGPMPGGVPDQNHSYQAQWRGHYEDATGFICMGARYYNFQGGHFLSADPLGQDGSMSLYDYCNGDPVNGYDPDGRVSAPGASNVESDSGTTLTSLGGMTQQDSGGSSSDVITNLGGISQTDLVNPDDESGNIPWANNNNSSDPLWNLLFKQYQQSQAIADDIEYQIKMGWITEPSDEQITSMALNMIPIVGQAKMLFEGASGFDIVTGQYISSEQQFTELLGGLAGVAGGLEFGALAASDVDMSLGNSFAANIEATQRSLAAEGAGGDFVTIYHGTTSNAASKILSGGFRPGADGAVFFGEDFSTAQHFGLEAIAENGASSGKVLSFQVPADLADQLGLTSRNVLGEFRGAPTIDIPNGSGFERILQGNNIDAFNQALRSGQITTRTIPISY